MSAHGTICPHCGSDVGQERDGWRLTETSALFHGADFGLTRQQAHILYLLANAEGAPIKGKAIGRMISDCVDPDALAKVQICKIRAKLGNAFPVQTVFGHGYKWSVAA